MSLADQFPLAAAAMVLCSVLSIALQVVAIVRRRDRVALYCARFATAAVLQAVALTLTAAFSSRAGWTVPLVLAATVQGLSALWSTATVIVKAVGPLPARTTDA